MGLHKLEIEVSDALLSRIDKVSAETGLSREEVVVERLEQKFPQDERMTTANIDERRQALRRIFAMTEKLGPGRSQEEIDRDVSAWREDRDHGL
ncbi:hypothetical protein LXM94_08980 [Rhizobium sp. TRM95111]|uniref:hypothetical protein n=1 Tax=Rhizobium alarense TaxID=2846851 RepID=UPI001F1AC1F0|nr:hypothetical protein [Rhizobium alarense]MCF3640101.1 hypothetical protein [Rhizobium alarense]